MTGPFGAVIVAAGEARRFGSDKAFAQLGDRPVLAQAIAPFELSPTIEKIVVVLALPNLALGDRLAQEFHWKKVICCAGGARRQDSVYNGLLALDGCAWVAIHDGARPLVTREMIERGLEAARRTGAAVAAVRVKDTVKTVGRDNVVVDTPERRSLWLAQTPQVFRYDTIVAAHLAATADVTDDAILVEQLGVPVSVYPGSYDNIKITTPEDLLIAECLLRTRQEEGK